MYCWSSSISYLKEIKCISFKFKGMRMSLEEQWHYKSCFLPQPLFKYDVCLNLCCYRMFLSFMHFDLCYLIWIFGRYISYIFVYHFIVADSKRYIEEWLAEHLSAWNNSLKACHWCVPCIDEDMKIMGCLRKNKKKRLNKARKKLLGC